MRIPATLSLLSTLAVTLAAQEPWASNLPAQGFAVDFLRPKFDGGQTSLTSGVVFLSGRFAFGHDAVKFELPYARLSVGGASSSTIGNPYLGFETGAGKDVRFEAGFRIPLTSESEEAGIMGLYSDVTRLEATLPHILSVVTRVRYHREDAAGMMFEVGGGPTGWIPTEGGDAEVVLNHYISGGYRGPKAWLSLGLGGVLILTEDLSFADRTIYQLGASAGLSQGRVRPALHVVFPLDSEIKSDVNMIIGLGVSVAVP